MRYRVTAAVMAVILLFGVMTAAFASEDDISAAQTETEPSEEITEQSAEEQEAADIEDSAKAAEETAAEVPADEDPFPDADHDDPMYYEMVERLNEPVADGASPYSSYTPRALNNETLYYGIDVSNWQGDINWKSVAASGVQFVFIRAAYRSVSAGTISTDSRFSSYISGAKAAGLLVGVYIYSQAITEAEGREEAQYLINLCKGYSIDLPLVLDYEYYGTSGRLYNAHLSQQAATNVCKAFCATVEAAGYESMVYGNPSMLNYSLYKSQLGRIWLAHFTTKTNYSGSYEYWQPGLGTISGISGSTDIDFWFRPNGVSSTPAPSATEATATPAPTAAATPTPTAVPTATPVPQDTAHPFSDVVSGDWFYDTVYQAYDLGIVNGVSSTAFNPNATTTRGQTIAMIYRMMGQPEVSQSTSFTDLTDSYYRDAVSWGVQSGVVKGVTATTFSPSGYITRQDLAVMLYRLEGEPARQGDLSAYSDASDVKSYAEDAMTWAVENGIITGFEDGTLRPNDNATRAQVCTMLMRYRSML